MVQTKARRREYMRERYRDDPVHREKHRARTKANDRRYREQVLGLVACFRANGCLLCPEKEPACMTAHHVDPATKDFDVGAAVSMKLGVTRVMRELRKCVCLCQNCHAKLHAGLFELIDVRARVTPEPAQLSLAV